MPRVPPILLRSQSDAEKAKGWIDRALKAGGWIVQFTKGSRSKAQNRLMWQRLEDISAQAEWDGIRLDKEDWKTVLMGGWRREQGESMRAVANWQRTGLESLGYRSSRLTVSEMTEFIDFIEYAGSQLGVTFRDLGDHQNNGSSQRKAS